MVRGTYDETKLLSEVVGESPQLQQLSNEVRSLPEDATYHARIRLGELVADAVAQRREQDEARVRELLAPHAVAEQAQEPQDALAAFSLAYLVDRAGMDRFSAAVQKASDELGERIKVRYVGPVPPLSFVGDQGVAAWG
jgi:cytochrome c-type biogenesis protein CcmE